MGRRYSLPVKKKIPFEPGQLLFSDLRQNSSTPVLWDDSWKNSDILEKLPRKLRKGLDAELDRGCIRAAWVMDTAFGSNFIFFDRRAEKLYSRYPTVFGTGVMGFKGVLDCYVLRSQEGARDADLLIDIFRRVYSTTVVQGKKYAPGRIKRNERNRALYLNRLGEMNSYLHLGHLIYRKSLLEVMKL